MTAIADRLVGSLVPARPDPPIPTGVPAGVLVPLIDGPAPVLVFTKRTEDVRDHKGEISFPGGVRHAEDPDLLTTALRETEEELGILSEDVEVLGALTPTHTIVSGYVIRPFVGRLARRPEYVPSPIEIAEVLEFEVSRLIEVERRDRRYDSVGDLGMYLYRLDGYTVWGATGRILHEFLETIEEASR